MEVVVVAVVVLKMRLEHVSTGVSLCREITGFKALIFFVVLNFP